MLAVIIDIETQEPITDEQSISSLRVSVAGTSCNGTTRIYTEEELTVMFDELDRADIIVGHNLLSFDYRVLEKYTTRERIATYTKKTFDILRIIERKTDRRVKLNDIAKRTLDIEKVGEGIDAPALFKEGKMNELREYLTQDLYITTQLFEHIKRHGTIHYGHINYKEPQNRTLNISIDDR